MASKITPTSNHYQRGLEEASLGPQQIFVKRIVEDTGPTFDYAWQHEKPQFFIKSAGVGVGALLMADGLYHISKGFDEEVDDQFLHRQTGRNHVRMFAGAVELMTGAAALYLGLTKGPRMIG